MGRYVPPDQEGLTSANKLAGKHALGARARHLQTKGALIVRFEMPFAVWCTNCKPNETIIGQGVRFNAEKKKVGNYYSTPIYSFRMKHTVCGQWIEIRTDPKNTAYIVTEGGRKRDTGEDKETGEPGEIRIKFPGDRTEEEKDAFARLEGKVEDKRQFDTAATRINELQKRQSRDWDDPYEQSRRLRKTFRTERHRLEKASQANESLKDKMSLGIDLLEETDEDRMRAGLVDFGPTTSDSLALATGSRNRPMFHDALSNRPSDEQRKKPHGAQRGKLKAELLAAERRDLLSKELRGNTRAAVDPFLNEDAKWWQPPALKTRKTREKKNSHASADVVGDMEETNPKATDSSSIGEKTPVALVTYGSDSE
jgi:coiled-coil domain-containing protein 130